MNIPLSIPAQMLGDLGESIAYHFFKQAGLAVNKPDAFHYGDLRIGAHTYIEVKTIRLGKDHTYSATLRKQGSQSLIYADFVLLYVVTPNEIFPYIIPSSQLSNLKRVKITSHPTIYTGKYSQFLNNWQLLFDHIKNVAQAC